MDTYNRIVAAISKFNTACGGQVNLASPAARADLGELIYNSIRNHLEVENTPYTFNNQQLELFKNLDDQEHK